MTVDRSKWPLFIRFTLWGISTRSIAWGFVLISVILAIGCLTWAFQDPRYFGGIAFLLSALWYYLAIRWVDQHGEWN